MDLFVVPTVGFDLLYAFVIIRLDRRDLVWINVTTNPTAEWIARQLTEAAPVARPVQRTGIMVHTQSLAGFITTMSGSRFSVHTAPATLMVIQNKGSQHKWG